MGDVVDLHNQPDISPDLVVDLARFSENLLTSDDVKRRWSFNDEVWEKLGSDERFIALVREESLRRMRDGSSKREKSQQLVLAAPSVLSGIMLDSSANAKHRIDSAKVLDDFAANGPEAAATAAERFVINIDLGGGHIVHIDKPIAVGPEDDEKTDTNSIDIGPQGLLPAIAAKKNEESGGGQGYL